VRYGAAGYNSIVPPINATTTQATAAIATASHRPRVASTADRKRRGLASAIAANRTVKPTALTRSAVVREALALIDRDGVDRFSIRRLPTGIKRRVSFTQRSSSHCYRSLDSIPSSERVIALWRVRRHSMLSCQSTYGAQPG
jgi:hypothetical protein